MKKNEAVALAIKHFGSQSKLAKVAGSHQQNVSEWLNCKRSVPLLACMKIEKASNGEITKEQLNQKFTEV